MLVFSSSLVKIKLCKLQFTILLKEIFKAQNLENLIALKSNLGKYQFIAQFFNATFVQYCSKVTILYIYDGAFLRK